MRKLSTQQEHLLAAVAKAREEEKLAISVANTEHRERLRMVRYAANAAVHAADAARVPKSHINRALGTTSPAAANDRLAEYAAQAEPVKVTVEAAGEELPVTPPVRVERHDEGGYTVHLDQFTHPDVGEGLTMSVRYNADDEVADDTDPMFAIALWSTKEVQGEL